MLGKVVLICSIGCECVKQVTHQQQIKDPTRSNQTQEHAYLKKKALCSFQIGKLIPEYLVLVRI